MGVPLFIGGGLLFFSEGTIWVIKASTLKSQYFKKVLVQDEIGVMFTFIKALKF